MTKGIAAILRQPGTKIGFEEILVDDPQDSEVLIRMIASGVCHTDLTLMKFGIYLPGCYGHEGPAVVEKVGKNVSKVKPGDHVVMCMVTGCGTCASCLKGEPMYCLNYNFAAPLSRNDGSHAVTSGGEGILHGPACSFASYMITSEKAVIKVPNDVSPEILGPFACGIQTGAGAVLNSLKVPIGSSIVVFGMGTVGLSAIMAAKIAGCKTIIGVDIVPHRLELAKELGATHIINGKEENTLDRVREIVPGGTDFAVDTVGNAHITPLALECTEMHTGVLGMIGAQSLDGTATFPLMSFLGGRNIIGICEGDSIPEVFIPVLIDLYKAGKFPVDRLMKFYKFEDLEEAFEDMEKGITIKPMVRF